MGIYYLLTVALKHRLWILVRTASLGRFLLVPTIYVLSKNKKNITICHIFTAITYRNLLYGRVIVMHMETASSLFDMRGSRKFSRGGGRGHLQTRVGPAPYQWSRHKSIKMGRSWHRILLLLHSEARTRFDDIDKP